MVRIIAATLVHAHETDVGAAARPRPDRLQAAMRLIRIPNPLIGGRAAGLDLPEQEDRGGEDTGGGGDRSGGLGGGS